MRRRRRERRPDSPVADAAIDARSAWRGDSGPTVAPSGPPAGLRRRRFCRFVKGPASGERAWPERSGPPAVAEDPASVSADPATGAPPVDTTATRRSRPGPPSARAALRSSPDGIGLPAFAVSPGSARSPRGPAERAAPERPWPEIAPVSSATTVGPDADVLRAASRASVRDSPVSPISLAGGLPWISSMLTRSLRRRTTLEAGPCALVFVLCGL